ncbi:unnamed protein product [Protopolystoma xenopodis]|uniref:Uncharacterized protein n=1 Tax=Protopolystoma xenopodis TaxID=117903 RepID=A0A448WB91_9PLAT|nr:unnamed protein product [Protopolystoma xenopodis]
MNTNLLFGRLSKVELRLHDEWRLREAARSAFFQQIHPTSRSHTSPHPNQLATAADSSATNIFELIRTDLDANTVFSQTESSAVVAASKTNIVDHTDVGAPPVYVMVNGELNWDQLQLAIVRTTTPDLLRSIQKVREYFEEQVREGRLSLIGQAFSSASFVRGSSTTFAAASNNAGPITREGDSHTANATYTEDSLIDRLLQRHWQSPMSQAIFAYFRELAWFAGDWQPHLNFSDSALLATNTPVMGGSLQLAGNLLGIACFAGSFRSAPDWAVFSIQHPMACFETEAQPELKQFGCISKSPSESHKTFIGSPTPAKSAITIPPLLNASSKRKHQRRQKHKHSHTYFLCPNSYSSQHKEQIYKPQKSPFIRLVTPPDPLSDSAIQPIWLNIRQVLSFDLGQQPQYRRQMVYVLRVRRGREQSGRLTVVPTIAEWMEFIFKAADDASVSALSLLIYVREARIC